MNEAVIVSTARTPIGKAYKGAFNNTHGATLAGHTVKKVIETKKYWEIFSQYFGIKRSILF